MLVRKKQERENVLHALEIPSTCDPCMHVRVPSADILRSRVLQSSYVKFKLDSVYHSKYTCFFVGCAGRMAISSPCRTRLSFYVTSYTERARIGEQVQTHSAIYRETCSSTIIGENIEIQEFWNCISTIKSENLHQDM